MKKLCLIMIFSLNFALWAQERQKIDFVVGVDGDFKAAQEVAAQKAPQQNRFVIFLPTGEYPIGTLTGDATQKTTFSTSNVSFIGQETQNTSITNRSSDEGIGITATLCFNKADNIYMQDITVHNKANYGNPSSYTETGRHVAVQEQGKKFIYKNVRLLSTQDTYYTKGTKTYWENGEIHGTTDFICGGGDVFFNECKIYTLKRSAITAASSTNNEWGYVFKNCTIDGNSNAEGYTLGRSWNDAKTVFIGTTLKLLPTAEGWGNPMNSVPQVFAEFETKNSSGQLLDLSSRRKTYSKNDITVNINPVLSANQAAQYTIENVLGGDDNWRPQDLSAQIAAPLVQQKDAKLIWNDQSKVRYWAIFKKGKYLDNTIAPEYALNQAQDGEIYTVRAANQMGGLGPASVPLSFVSGPQDYYSYQCEYGEMHESIFEDKTPGFNGSGYVNFNPVLGSSVSVPIYLEKGGNYLLNLRYANGSDYTRYLSVEVDGQTQKDSWEFPPTGAWNQWMEDQIEVEVPAGSSTVKFTTIDANDGPNLDQFEFQEKPTQEKPTHLKYRKNHAEEYFNGQNHWSNKALKLYDLQGKRISP